MWEGLRNPRVLMLAAAYFCVVTAQYGTEFFLPTLLERWYKLKLDTLAALVIIPPIGALAGQIFMAWSSDRTKERRLHTIVPIAIGAATLALMPLSLGSLFVTMTLLIVARTGMKAYMPSFWTLPGLFLTQSAAAGSVGLINSVGNLGGFLGPYVLGQVDKLTGSFHAGIYFLAGIMALAVGFVLALGLGGREKQSQTETA